jgi:phage terminase large subunit-like protein
MDGNPVNLDAVELRITELYNIFNVVSIVYDPTHLLQMMMRLKNRGLPVRPFEQTQTNMVMASQLLFDLLRNRNLEAYPADDLRRHLQMAVAETSARGFRIVKNKISKRHHIDGAVSLAMASYDAVSNGGADISVPVRLDSPFSDMSVLTAESQMRLPPELRD